MTKHSERPAEDVRLPAADLVVSSTPPYSGEVRLASAASDREGEEPTGRPTGGLTAYLHAFRRHWPLAMSVGLACAIAAAIPAWFLTTDKYTAVSLLRISSNEQQLVFQTPSASPFEIYKGTQQQLLTSDVVLTTALRKPEAASLAVIKKEDDPVRWLAKNLRVDFPGNAEIMRVSLSGDRADEVAVLVRAVVDAYMNEAVDAERHRQKNRLDDLERLYAEKESEMRSRRNELKALENQLGASDTGALALKQQIALQQYAEARNEFSRLRSELQRAMDDLQIKQDLHKALQAAVQQSPDAEAAGSADPTVTQVIEQVEEIEHRLVTILDSVKGSDVKEQTMERMSAQKVIESKLAELRKELGVMLQKTNRVNFDLQIAELKARIAILVAQEKAAAEDLDKQRQKAEQFGNPSIDVEMMRSELQYLERVLAPIADEREKLKIELRSTPRIEVFQRAETPKSPDPLFVLPDIDPKTRQRVLVMLIVLAAMLVPAGLVLWWTGRRRHLPQ